MPGQSPKPPIVPRLPLDKGQPQVQNEWSNVSMEDRGLSFAHKVNANADRVSRSLAASRGPSRPGSAARTPRYSIYDAQQAAAQGSRPTSNVLQQASARLMQNSAARAPRSNQVPDANTQNYGASEYHLPPPARPYLTRMNSQTRDGHQRTGVNSMLATTHAAQQLVKSRMHDEGAVNDAKQAIPTGQNSTAMSLHEDEYHLPPPARPYLAPVNSQTRNAREQAERNATLTAINGALAASRPPPSRPASATAQRQQRARGNAAPPTPGRARRASQQQQPTQLEAALGDIDSQFGLDAELALMQQPQRQSQAMTARPNSNTAAAVQQSRFNASPYAVLDALTRHYNEYRAKIEQIDALVHEDLGSYARKFKRQVQKMRDGMLLLHQHNQNNEVAVPDALSDVALERFGNQPPLFRVAVRRCTNEALILPEFGIANSQQLVRTKEQDKILEVYPLYQLREDVLEALVRLHKYTLDELPSLAYVHQAVTYNRIPTCTLRKHFMVLWYAYSPGMEGRYKEAYERIRGAIVNIRDAAIKQRVSAELQQLTQLRWVYTQRYWTEEVIEVYTKYVGVYVSIRKVAPAGTSAVGYQSDDSRYIKFKLSKELREVVCKQEEEDKPLSRRSSSSSSTSSAAASASACMGRLAGSTKSFGPFKPIEKFNQSIRDLLATENKATVLLITYGYSGTGKTYNVEEFLTQQGTAHRRNVAPVWLPADRTYFYQNDDKVEQPNGTRLDRELAATFLRPTPNNPESSRAFKFIRLLNSPLTVLDMAGHEDAMWFITLMMPTLNHALWKERTAKRALEGKGDVPIQDNDRLYMLFNWLLDSVYLASTRKLRAYTVPTGKDWQSYMLPFKLGTSATNKTEYKSIPDADEYNVNKPSQRHAHKLGYVLEMNLMHHVLFRLFEQGDRNGDRIHAMGCFVCFILMESLVLGVDSSNYLAQFTSTKTSQRYTFQMTVGRTPLFVKLGEVLTQFNFTIRAYFSYLYTRWAMVRVVNGGRWEGADHVPTIFEVQQDMINMHATYIQEYDEQVYMKETQLKQEKLKGRKPPDARIAWSNDERVYQLFGDMLSKWNGDGTKAKRVEYLAQGKVQSTVNAMLDPELVQAAREQLYYEFNKDSGSDEVRVYAYYLKMVDLMTRQRPRSNAKITDHERLALTPWTEPLLLPPGTLSRPKAILDAAEAYMLSCVKADLVSDDVRTQLRQEGKDVPIRVYDAAEVTRLVAEAQHIRKVNDNLQQYLTTREKLPRGEHDNVTDYIADQDYSKIFVLANIRDDTLLSQQVGAYKTLQYVQGIKSTD